MKLALKLVTALTLTSAAFGAYAQGTKPMPKDARMESKSEEKMESMENAKSGKTMHHGTKKHHAKAGMKGKM